VNLLGTILLTLLAGVLATGVLFFFGWWDRRRHPFRIADHYRINGRDENTDWIDPNAKPQRLAVGSRRSSP
jgi:hypothetical protein